MRIDRDYVRTLSVTGGLFVLFVAGVLLPLYYQRSHTQQRIDQSRQMLGYDLIETQSLKQLGTDVRTLREVIHRDQQYVPNENELADVLRGLSEAMTTFGIQDRQINIHTTQDYADYSTIAITLKFKTSFASVYGLLKRIESMRRLIRVDEMKLKTKSQDPTDPLKIELALSVFVAREVDDNE